MARVRARWLVLAAIVCLSMFPGCEADGVGDPCIPEDEYNATFAGFALSEINAESRSFQCQTRLCLVNHFQGRVSCPYGQTSEEATSDPQCTLPGSEQPVSAPVRPQLLERRVDQAVYCSCRCAGPDPSARYCECPDGFSCTPVVPNFGLGRDQLPGSYCVRHGSSFDPNRVDTTRACNRALENCED